MTRSDLVFSLRLICRSCDTEGELEFSLLRVPSSLSSPTALMIVFLIPYRGTKQIVLRSLRHTTKDKRYFPVGRATWRMINAPGNMADCGYYVLYEISIVHQRAGGIRMTRMGALIQYIATRAYPRVSFQEVEQALPCTGNFKNFIASNG